MVPNPTVHLPTSLSESTELELDGPATEPTATSGRGRDLAPEISMCILDHLSRADLLTMRYVNRTWSALATRHLATHATLGLPVLGEQLPYPADLPPHRNEIRPVPPTQLASLNLHASMTTRLDVLPHTNCDIVEMPNLEILSLFPVMRRGGPGLCGHSGEPCSSLACLRPKTLVVASLAGMSEILPKIPALLPASTLSSVTKLVLVARMAGPDAVHLTESWAQNIELILAFALGRNFLPAQEHMFYPIAFCAQPPTEGRFVVVGGRLDSAPRLDEDHGGWIDPVAYFEDSKEFSKEEVAPLCYEAIEI